MEIFSDKGRYFYDPQKKENILSDKGKFSKVYKGINLDTNENVVIKVFNKKLEEDPIALNLFKQEALLRFEHENIIKIIDYIHFEDNYYIITEFLNGKTLKQLIPELKLSKNEKINFTLDITNQLLNALHVVHSFNVIHCDVKPSNIFIISNKQNKFKIKLIDFGQAYVPKLNVQAKRENAIFALLYSAPEVVLSKYELICPATDIYSVGLIMYEILNGNLFLVTENPLKTMTLQITYPTPDIKWIPTELNNIIKKATNKYIFARPFHKYNEDELKEKLTNGISQRYQSALEMLNEISKFKQSYNNKQKSFLKKILGI